MTTVTELITDAYRQGNLIALGTVPSAAQLAEGLRYLNRLVKSVFGNEAGENLQQFALGRGTIDRPSGYPWYGDVPPADWFVPNNTQLMCNLDNAATVYLHPLPVDGTRVGVNDLALNFSTNSLTLDGNGRRIDGGTSVLLNEDGIAKVWFYRDDLGEWLTVTPLDDLEGIFPFPEEFDMFFIGNLAMLLNPAYGAQIDQQTAQMFSRSKSQFQARYHGPIETPTELALIRLPWVARDRVLRGTYGYYWDPNAAFRTGYPF